MTPRKSLSIAKLDENGNGNGKVYVSINLTLLHWVLVIFSLVIAITAGMIGLMRGMIPVFIDPAIEAWIAKNHAPVHASEHAQLRAEIRGVSEKQEMYRNERQIEVKALQSDVSEIKVDVGDIRRYLMGRKSGQ